MTKRLAANRHLKGPRVLYGDNGQPATRAAVSRYMHLSPEAKYAAISLLDEAASRISGDMLETEFAPKQKPEG
jgi:hypothetical protein